MEPHFLAVYEFGGLVVLKQTGAVREATQLLNYGYRMNPDHWEIPFHLGYIELFYNGKDKAAMKWLSQAITLPDTPSFVSHLYGSFLESGKSPDIYIKIISKVCMRLPEMKKSAKTYWNYSIGLIGVTRSPSNRPQLIKYIDVA